MAISFINLLGKGREELALVMIGLIVSMAVFCDSVNVLVPLVKAISRSTGKSVVGLGATLAAGLVIISIGRSRLPLVRLAWYHSSICRLAGLCS